MSKGKKLLKNIDFVLPEACMLINERSLHTKRLSNAIAKIDTKFL